MNKKPFWKRTNRGFVFSMVLLAVVLVYVIITQLMLIPERNAIRELTDIYRGMMEQTSTLTDEKIDTLQDTSAFNQEADKLKSELSKYFVKDSAYINDAVEPLLSNIRRQRGNGERITKLSKGEKKEESIMIDQDIAKLSVRYSYTLSGKYFDYTTDKLEDVNDAELVFDVSISFKKVNGEWKIYRISNAYWSNLTSIGKVRGG
jgi:hypothetical protein